jgi:import inner membrane translocase subunit TIM13
MATLDMAARKEAVMTAVRNEIALTNAQQLMNVNLFRFHKPPHALISTQSANERCYKACITKPGTSLSSSEQVIPVYAFPIQRLEISTQTCLSRCLDRYMEACKSFYPKGMPVLSDCLAS